MSEENSEQTTKFEAPNGNIYTVGVDNSDGDSYSVVTTTIADGSISAPTLTWDGNMDTGFYVDSQGTLSFATGGNTINWDFDIAGVKVNREMVRDYLESQYITNKITREQLVEYLKKYYNNEGLNMAEEIEKMEIAKENFIKSVKESV